MKPRLSERPYPILCRLGLVLTLLLLLGSMKTSVYELGRQVVSHGVADMAGGSYQMRGTVGQGAIGFTAGGTHQHGVGFWYTVNRISPTSAPELPDQPALRNRLDQNSPNPFNPRTTIRFALAESGHVNLKLFDVRGRLVAQLIDSAMDAGEHELVFQGDELSSGVYVYQLRSGGFMESRRFTLLK